MDKHGNPRNGEVDNNVFRRVIPNQIARDISFDEENVPYNTPRSSVHSSFGGSSGRAVASTSGSHNTDSVSPGPGEFLRDPGSILSLQPWIFKISSSKNHNERMHASAAGHLVQARILGIAFEMLKLLKFLQGALALFRGLEEFVVLLGADLVGIR